MPKTLALDFELIRIQQRQEAQRIFSEAIRNAGQTRRPMSTPRSPAESQAEWEQRIKKAYLG